MSTECSVPVLRAQSRSTILPPPFASARIDSLKLGLAPLHIGSDVAQTAVTTVRPGGAR